MFQNTYLLWQNETLQDYPFLFFNVREVAVSRPNCQYCGFILKRCICDLLITPIANNTKIIVLRDKSEVHHAKNTANLLPLILKNVRIYDGNIDELDEALKNEELANSALLYPSNNAKRLDCGCNTGAFQFKTIIVLDGSWKKAYKIYKSISLLQTLDKVTFDNVPKSRYRIRATNLDYSLSTFEASILALSYLETLDYISASSFFEAYIDRQLSLMPEHIKSTYSQGDNE